MRPDTTRKLSSSVYEQLMLLRELPGALLQPVGTMFLPFSPSCLNASGAVSCMISLWLAGALSIHFGAAAWQRFHPWYHGDVSAFFTGAWFVSLPMLVAVAASGYSMALGRHMQTAQEPDTGCNGIAMHLCRVWSLALLGLSVVNQECANWNPQPPAYPFRCNAIHGFFMVTCFASLLAYQMLHALCLMHDAHHLRQRLKARVLAVVQIFLVIGQVIALGFFFVQKFRERFSDDPARNKLGEWMALAGLQLFLLTMVVLSCLLDAEKRGDDGAFQETLLAHE